ncbi:MAG: rubrerythrin family protein [Anaerolineales bacterium]|nr:rubrerythrin family protein [Anaerolineales bacterium]
MKKITYSNLQKAFVGESEAHVRYSFFAERAKKDGLVNIARLFEAAAASEKIHAESHLKAMDGVQDTPSNLAAAAGGEEFEIEEMYPSYIASAELQAEKKAQRSMNNALQAEKIHLNLYRRAAADLTAGKDIGMQDYFVCPVCGYTMEGDPPDVCPVCGAKHELFVKY